LRAVERRKNYLEERNRLKMEWEKKREMNIKKKAQEKMLKAERKRQRQMERERKMEFDDDRDISSSDSSSELHGVEDEFSDFEEEYDIKHLNRSRNDEYEDQINYKAPVERSSVPESENLEDEDLLKRPEELLPRLVDLSAREGHVVLCEYIEEFPLILQNIGMSSELLWYYRFISNGMFCFAFLFKERNLFQM
jgi:hypothetical protein